MIQASNNTNSVFEEPWWFDTVTKGKWKEALVKRDNIIVARLPYVCNARNDISKPILTQTIGPWMSQEYRQKKPGNAQFYEQKNIIFELINQLDGSRNVDLTLDSINTYVLPYIWKGYNIKPAFSYRINNLTGINNIYDNFNQTVKKNIKYAINKVKIIDKPKVSQMLELLTKTFANQKRNTPFDNEIVKNIIEKVINNGNGKLIIAGDTLDNIHSGAFLLYDERVCYYLLGGNNYQFRSSGSQNLVLWEAIQFASSVSKTFDFEGSNVEGIENFFRQFGGDIITNYNITKFDLANEFKMMLKPRVKKMLGYRQ